MEKDLASKQPQKWAKMAFWLAETGFPKGGNRFLPQNFHNFKAKTGRETGFPISGNRFLLRYFQKISANSSRILCYTNTQTPYDHVPREHEIASIETSKWEHTTRITKRLHLGRCRSTYQKIDLTLDQPISKIIFNSAPKIKIQSFDWENWWRKSVWMKV